MYNLIVSANDEDWSGKSFFLETDRFLEYTDSEIFEKFKPFTAQIVKEIKKLPCIFAYETQCQKNPKFGMIKDITYRNGSIRIDYEIVKLNKFLKYNDFFNLSFGLAIGKFEMNRTHWAIKDVNLNKELQSYNIIFPDWIQQDTNTVDISKHFFDVALSFPGEVRANVEKIIIELEKLIGLNSYFYDNNYKAQLAQPSLDILLQDIYRNRSKLIVIFSCSQYQEKLWCGVEFRAISEIIFEKQKNKIMFIRMDDGRVEGIFNTDGYIDWKAHTPLEIAKFIKERVDLLK